MCVETPQPIYSNSQISKRLYVAKPPKLPSTSKETDAGGTVTSWSQFDARALLIVVPKKESLPSADALLALLQTILVGDVLKGSAANIQLLGDRALYAVLPIQEPSCTPSRHDVIGLTIKVYEVPKDRRAAVHGFAYVINVLVDKDSSTAGSPGKEGRRLYVYLRLALWQAAGLPAPGPQDKYVCRWEDEEVHWPQILANDARIRSYESKLYRN
jgi:hypothetical protein